MPVVSHPNLPSLERMESSELVFKEDDSRVESFSKNLHIGFLNLMPDAAFQATERQFVSMLASDYAVSYTHLTLPTKRIV